MNIKIPKVTVISLYYNRQDNVKESVQSLIDQTYQNLEILIVDDFSTDNTFDQLQELSLSSSRITVIRNEKNKGFTQTLIDTIKSVESQYIAIHGSGDFSFPTRIQEQVLHLESYSDVGLVTVDVSNSNKPRFHKLEITYADLLKKNRIIHGAVMFRKEIYDLVGGYRSFFTSRQDKDLWYRVSLKTKIHFLSKKLYKLENIQSSVSQTASKDGMPLFLSAFAKHLIVERKKNGYDSLDKLGYQSLLIFPPQKANKLIYQNIFISCYTMQFGKVRNYLDILIKINTNPIKIVFFKAIKIILSKIEVLFIISVK